MALSRGECLLRYYRNRRGLTQDELADLVKDRTGLPMSGTMISQFERKHRLMSPEQMRAMCIVLGCTEEELYRWRI